MRFCAELVLTDGSPSPLADRACIVRAMTATRLDGKALSREIREHLAQRVEGLRHSGRRVRLDAVLAPCRGDDAARVYAESQGRMATIVRCFLFKDSKIARITSGIEGKITTFRKSLL